jgi:hypothetical protein
MSTTNIPHNNGATPDGHSGHPDNVGWSSPGKAETTSGSAHMQEDVVVDHVGTAA